MGMFKEFKEFALRGNVVDLAVGVIIGGAFGKIVSSLVDNIMMPVVGYFTGGVDFKDKVITLVKSGELGAKVDVTIGYGVFINTVINFLIVAFCMFLVIKAMNAAVKKAPPPPPAGPTADQKLLTEIRDLLAAKR